MVKEAAGLRAAAFILKSPYLAGVIPGKVTLSSAGKRGLHT